MKMNSGGPAFPGKASINRSSNELQPHQFGNDDFETLGMTLRDYFAAHALQGLLAGLLADGSNISEASEESICDCAFRYADKMLRAREA